MEKGERVESVDVADREWNGTGIKIGLSISFFTLQRRPRHKSLPQSVHFFCLDMGSICLPVIVNQQMVSLRSHSQVLYK